MAARPAKNAHAAHCIAYGYARRLKMTIPEDIVFIIYKFYYNPMIISMIDFTASKKEIEFTKKIYEDQCPGLVPCRQEYRAFNLCKVSTYGRKNELPLFTLILDSYMRDRINHYYEYKEHLSLTDWENEYKTLTNLTKYSNNSMVKDILKSSICFGPKHYISFLRIDGMVIIDDSISIYADFIAECISFINSLIDEVSPPFQIELMIIPKKLVDEDEDSDEDSDDSSDSEWPFDTNADNDPYDPFKAMPDISKNLQELKLAYQHETLLGDHCPSGIFHKLMRSFKAELDTSYPHKHRLCIVVDRRRKDTEIFMFEPNIYNAFPKDRVDEWCFEASYRCIIPGKEAYDRVTAKRPNGYLFDLSLHVQDIDIIKCYLYTRGCVSRFFPVDVYKLFPSLFNMEREDNQSFLTSEKNKGRMERIRDIKLKDILFESFRSQTNDAYHEEPQAKEH